MQIATLTRQPKLVDSAREENPNGLKSLQNALQSETRGLSSETTTHVRTQFNETPLSFS